MVISGTRFVTRWPIARHLCLAKSQSSAGRQTNIHHIVLSHKTTAICVFDITLMLHIQFTVCVLFDLPAFSASLLNFGISPNSPSTKCHARPCRNNLQKNGSYGINYRNALFIIIYSLFVSLFIHFKIIMVAN